MKTTILVVEDEPAMRRALHDKLTLNEYTVIQAASGTTGLDEALHHHPDLIVTDILMPHMHGLEMIERLRRDPWGQTVPIIILTNISDMTYSAKAADLNAEIYIIKSDIRLDDLLLLIRKQLKLS